MLRIILVMLLICIGCTPVSGTPSDGDVHELITLTTENSVSLREVVSPRSMMKAIVAIMSNKSNTIYLYINSPGGSVDPGLRLITIIKTMHTMNKKVICIADYAASMAFSIFQSCDERIIVENATIMQHQIWLQTQGKLSQIESEIAEIRAMSNKIHSEEAKRMKLSLDDFEDAISRDWWLFDKEILDNKGADRMARVTCDQNLISKKEVDVFSSPLGSVEVIWSACPVIPEPIDIKYKVAPGANRVLFTLWVNSISAYVHRSWKQYRIVQ